MESGLNDFAPTTELTHLFCDHCYKDAAPTEPRLRTSRSWVSQPQIANYVSSPNPYLRKSVFICGWVRLSFLWLFICS